MQLVTVLPKLLPPQFLSKRWHSSTPPRPAQITRLVEGASYLEVAGFHP